MTNEDINAVLGCLSCLVILGIMIGVFFFARSRVSSTNPYSPPIDAPIETIMEAKVFTNRTVIYDNADAMKRGIREWENAGWQVLSTTQLKQDYGCMKTCVLGCLFLPLALLGKKPDKYQVIYQKS